MKIEELLEIHNQTCSKCFEVMKKKNHDYTNGSGDPFKNFRSAVRRGIDPKSGILLRVDDKLERIDTFIRIKELKVSDESVYDAIDDVINYMILLKGMFIELKKNNIIEDDMPPPYYNHFRIS